MCGLAGVLHLQEPIRSLHELLEAMLERLLHRGPDDLGIYIAPGERVGLGARRLSIIDLVGGAQPMCNEDEAVWCVHNGVVYNFNALRTQLQEQGHSFRSRCDSEVLVHAYEAWDVEMLTHLRGMFAFALWDARRERLLLARDRLGKKPLYYTEHQGRLLFASEVKALLAEPDLPRRVNPGVLWRLFTLGYVQGEQTLFAGVRRLQPGCYLLVEGGAIRTERYWDLPVGLEAAERPDNLTEASSRLRKLLYEAVHLRLQSDVPVGALVSGGVDSSAVAALAHTQDAKPLHTFNISFEAAGYDESQHAWQVAEHLGCQHHEVSFALNDFELYPQALWHVEQPECFGTLLPLYRLYEACHRAGFKVMLTGEGADELLAGYHWFRGEQRSQLFRRIPLAMRALFLNSPPVRRLSSVTRRMLATPNADSITRYLHWHTISTREQRAALFGGAPSVDEEVEEIWRNRFQDALGDGTPLQHFLYLERRTRLPAYINHELDAMSMAHSVEARAPFLDHRLWQEVAAWPEVWKLPRWGREKSVLRRAMAGALPSETLQRPKQGLAAPLSMWWRGEPMPAFVEDMLAPATLRATGYFASEVVSALRDEHQMGQADHSQLLMGVLSMQLWHHRFLSPPSL